MTTFEALALQLRTAARLSRTALARSAESIRAAEYVGGAEKLRCEWDSDNRGGR